MGLFFRQADAASLVSRERTKIIIVGDSISQGHEGDYTWRYRLWDWLQSNNVNIDFVGPYNGTQPLAAPTPPAPPPLQNEVTPAATTITTGGYSVDISTAFDKNHLALWGHQIAQFKDVVADQVRAYDPDYMLVELGFNDLGWYASDANGTLQNMKTLVDNAHAAKSNLKFAISNVPQRSYIDRDDLPVLTDQYNDLLAKAIPTWTSATSPIQLVEFRENYDCDVDVCPVGYDGLHPNALGEFQIARVFSAVLHDTYGLGSAVLTIPSSIPAQPCPVPANFVASTSPSGIMVTWDAVYGAFGYEVQSRSKGTTAWSTGGSVSTNRYDKGWILDDQEYEFQARTSCGGTVTSGWTGVSSAVVKLETAPGPKNITTKATSNGIQISWLPPDGTWAIDRYAVVTFDKDAPGAYLAVTAVKGQSATIAGLISGHHYIVEMATWTDKGGGFPAFARGVTIGAGTPPAPNDLKVLTIDAVTVRLRWTGSSSAFGYRFWVRNIDDGSVSKADESYSDVPCYGIAYLIHGVWNYEFCVSAFNGNDESVKGNCVVASSTSTSDVRSCPTYTPLGPS
ncbi:fibronectin type III domain-containing protein [Xylariales sp. AK1849]|nr:fibronectin type III domain-containing protein [Xylariales sp. AK1849]